MFCAMLFGLHFAENNQYLILFFYYYCLTICHLVFAGQLVMFYL